VLTDDNFATLVRAVDLGRDIYRRISTYVRLQLTILSSVLQLMVYATIFNINGGVALFPLQLLFCKFFVVITVVIGFIVDVPDPGVMQRPPRKPGTKIVTTPQVIRWFITGWRPTGFVDTYIMPFTPFPCQLRVHTRRASGTPVPSVSSDDCSTLPRIRTKPA
jgi:magnesium-transporting ATPase (P-type)